MDKIQRKVLKKIINKHFALEDKIYHSLTDVIIGDWDYFHKFLKKKKITPDEPNKNWLAETGSFLDDDGVLDGWYIRIPEINFTNQNYCVITHELSHLTFNVLHNAGVEFDAHNQEAYSYLLEMFLSDFLTKAMKLYKK